MPKVTSHTPPWLCRPSSGANLFSHQSPLASTHQLDHDHKTIDAYEGPQRSLAKRGTEVFVVVENQIRWSNLVFLKEKWQSGARSKGRFSRTEIKNETARLDGSARKDTGGQISYRVLTVPVYGQIRQLIISPNGTFMAIITAHTVHVSVLPDSSHLSESDTSPIRLRTYQLGPTTHVIPESPVISAIWHPLGVHNHLGGCMVTVTADAAVRVWEVDRNNHWSFDQPTIAIDLKKLVDAASSDEDILPSGFGMSKGFSADSIDMEVAASCFGGDGHAGEDPWAPMTLWVAMKPGDLYALCPLLPSKWQVSSTIIPSLSTVIIPKLVTIEENETDSKDKLIAGRQQYDWLREIDSQVPLSVVPDSGTGADTEILSRPVNSGMIPRLQGPFRFDIGGQGDNSDLSDLNVIPAKLDLDHFLTGEGENALEDAMQGVSVAVICLSTTCGRVYICLELDGVEGQWLSKTESDIFKVPDFESSDLFLLESLDTVKASDLEPNSRPTFTKDVHSRYNFFVTTANNVTFVSLSSWAKRLEAELRSEDVSGSAFRLNVLCEGPISLREAIIQLSTDETSSREVPNHLSSSLVLSDFDLGNLLLTYRGSCAYAAAFDSPHFPSISGISRLESDISAHGLPAIPRRPPYQVPSILYVDNPMEFFVEKYVPQRRKSILKEKARLSPFTLDLIAAAHRTLSAHTNALERAASDLFRRCQRLQGEMRDQLKQLADTAERIKDISSEISKDGQRKPDSRTEGALDKRLSATKERQEHLVLRYDKVRNKISKLGGRPLSEREKAWISEVDCISDSIKKSEDREDRSDTLARRFETAKSLAADLLADVKRALSESSTLTEYVIPPGNSQFQARIPQQLQRTKMADAMRMVERESAVIEAITSKLERLNTSL